MANFISTKNEHFLIFGATIVVNEIVAISMLMRDVGDILATKLAFSVD